MMSMRSLWVLPLVALLAITGCDRVDPNSPLGQRKAIFKDMLKTNEDLGGMLRGRIPFDEEKFATLAQHLDEVSRKPWQHFPQAKEEHSEARDDVWQQQEKFKTLAQELEAATAALAARTQQQPFTANDVRKPQKAVEQACEKCHDAFRIY